MSVAVIEQMESIVIDAVDMSLQNVLTTIVRIVPQYSGTFWVKAKKSIFVRQLTTIKKAFDRGYQVWSSTEACQKPNVDTRR